jgi:hypothetical protein
MKDRQYSGQRKKDKSTQNDQQNIVITSKSEDRETRTTLTTGDKLMCFIRVSNSCSTCGIRHATIKGY